MKAGTIVELPDGRIGTLAYKGLDGYGIKWGRHAVTEEILNEARQRPGRFDWYPDAMLREDYSSAEATMEYVGSDYTVIL